MKDMKRSGRRGNSAGHKRGHQERQEGRAAHARRQAAGVRAHDESMQGPHTPTTTHTPARGDVDACRAAHGQQYGRTRGECACAHLRREEETEEPVKQRRQLWRCSSPPPPQLLPAARSPARHGPRSAQDTRAAGERRRATRAAGGGTMEREDKDTEATRTRGAGRGRGWTRALSAAGVAMEVLSCAGRAGPAASPPHAKNTRIISTVCRHHAVTSSPKPPA